MRDPADPAAFIEAENTVLGQATYKCRKVPAVYREVHEVGLRRWSQFDPGNLGESFGGDPSVLVVVGQALDHVLERVYTCRREHARLPHASA